MTSGMTYHWGESPTEKEVDAKIREKMRTGALNNQTLIPLMASIPLKFDPGTKWHYGMNHEVLGGLIERLTQQSLGEFFRKEIFEPLGMHDTHFHVPEQDLHRLATLYDRAEDGTLSAHDADDEFIQVFSQFESGGAGLYSTLEDYSRFAQMLAAGGTYQGVRILGRRTVEQMRTNHLKPDQFEHFSQPFLRGCGYGLGVLTLMDIAEAGTNATVGQFGWMGAAGTLVFIDPIEQLTSVYMQQMMPNFEEIHGPILRSAIYSMLD